MRGRNNDIICSGVKYLVNRLTQKCAATGNGPEGADEIATVVNTGSF